MTTGASHPASSAASAASAARGMSATITSGRTLRSRSASGSNIGSCASFAILKTEVRKLSWESAARTDAHDCGLGRKRSAAMAYEDDF